MIRSLICVALLATTASAADDARGLRPLSVVASDGREVVRFTSHHALIIGNSRYSNGWQPLPGVLTDVREVRAALECQGFAVEVAMDLTRTQLDERISSFVAEKAQDPDGRVVLYYAGHGQTLRSNQGQETGYLVPVDAPVPGDGTRPAFIAKAYPIQRIKIAAQEMGCRHALLLFDACFSGSLFAPLRGGNSAILQQAAEPVRMFITSGSSDEQVPDQSVFREELVAALDQGVADANGDGWTTGSELSLHLRQQVMGRRAAAGGRQTPQAGISEQAGLNRGDVVFRSTRIQTPAEPPTQTTSAVVATAPVAAAGAVQWAMAHGQDAIGRWAEVAVDGATQRLRLVPGGADVDALWVADSECTQALWRAVTGQNPSSWTGQTRFKQLVSGAAADDSGLPVENVTWDEVQRFLQALNGRIAGLQARLPTEQEWAWACTMGRPLPANLDGLAATRTSGARNPQTVRSLAANAAGLHDMLGNVWEWCADPWTERSGAPDPALERLLRLGRTREQAAGAGAQRRVLRGGGFLDKAAAVTLECRLGEKPDYRSRDLGFRFVVTP